jgi:anti-sigma regulatory factor (Ser/Thr protein kinase)
MTALICQVTSRWPVAKVSTYGTLDVNSVARLMVSLRDSLADGPSALMIDVTHLVVAADSALVPLIALANEAALWPAALILLGGASDETAAAAERVGFGERVRVYHDAEAAAAVARDLPVSRRRTMTLHPEPSAPSQSRDFTTEVCAEWELGRVASLAELVASELVTNAVMHARTEIGMALRLSGDTLSVAVRDFDPRPMSRPESNGFGAPTDEHGRGLLLLDAMADAWGSTPTADGKVVWANISIRKSRPTRS